MMLDAALTYARDGFRVFPCEKKIPIVATGFKAASSDETQIRKWWSEHPHAQIGLPTGCVNKIFVLDIDGPGGAAIAAKWQLPETLTIETRPGRQQFWFRQASGIETKCTAGILGYQLDTRGDGGYVIAPPSIHHETGQPYRIAKKLPLAEAPSFLLQPKKNEPHPPAVKDEIPQGRRHNTLLSLAGSLRARGFSREGVLKQLEIMNLTLCKPPLEESELQKIAGYVGSKPASPGEVPAGRHLRAVSVSEILRMDVTPREMLLHPFLPTQGLAMLYSKRGVGKTFISLGISVAVAGGCHFLNWNAPAARKVLYVDGEMPFSALHKRILDIIAGFDIDHPLENLSVITPDLQDHGLPDLATISGQDAIEEHLEGVSLLVLDNLSCLVRAVKENEGEGWLPVQDWALDLRRRSISVLFNHHAGKGGAQRGTSRREDLLDSVITLKHPADYVASEGLRCIVEYEKSRGFYGDDARSFEVKMGPGPSGEAVWTVTDSEDSHEARITELSGMGMSVRDIAEELGIPKSTVHRHLKRLQEKRGVPL